MTDLFPRGIVRTDGYDLRRSLVWFDVLAMAFVSTLLISNVIAQKLISVGPFTLTAVAAWIIKVAYEAAATPMTYLLVGFLKREEGFDQFDSRTDFNPFKLSTP